MREACSPFGKDSERSICQTVSHDTKQRSVRYEQAYEGKDESSAQRSGFLRASSEATGDDLWTLKIYNVEIDATLERDVQEVYFATLSVDGQARTIVVENERGRTFLVNIDTQAITAP